MRGVLLKEAEKWPWAKKVNTNFFRGEQTQNRNRLRELAKVCMDWLVQAYNIALPC
jgi:hypothetical protein